VFSPRTPLPEIVVLIDADLMHEPAPSPFADKEMFNQEGILSGLLRTLYPTLSIRRRRTALGQT
jgi:hypothetical protein